MKETSNLEFKREFTKTFLKTVSAFANYQGGKILFGVDNDGEVVGVDDPTQMRLNIENSINDNISPVPDYKLSVDEATKVITLDVKEGIYKPYLFKSIAYKRNDTATIAVERQELNRLFLEGSNLTFEQITAANQDLTFEKLHSYLAKEMNIQEITQDILKTLELYTDDHGYNNAAALVSDHNIFNGIDSVRIDATGDIMQDREIYENMSILQQFDLILNKFSKYYKYDIIQGSRRNTYELIPEKAFREAIANALVHRQWDINSNINVAMYEDKIEISSPGGLPFGISVETFLDGGLSLPRNRIIASLFLRLNIIERFGTGIRRINAAYKNCKIKPQYNVKPQSVQIILPVITSIDKLPQDEKVLYNLIKNSILTSSELIKESTFGKTKTIYLLNSLIQKGCIKKIGNGRGTKYTAV